MSRFLQNLFWVACMLGRRFGGIRPRRIYRWLARVAFPTPTLAWHRSCWGYELELSPYFHIDREILFAGCYEKPLHRFLMMHLRPGMTCMDVGANLGDVAIHMGTLVGLTGVVHAFEPADYPRRRLARNIARNNLAEIVRVHAVALSDVNGSRSFAVADDSATNQGMGSLVNMANETTTNVEIVPCRTLDDYAESLGLPALDVVKVDIQGSEPFFLKGATRTLSRFRPMILMEISQADLVCAGWTAPRLIELISGLGYEVRFLTESGRAGKVVSIDGPVPGNYSLPAVVCMPTET